LLEGYWIWSIKGNDLYVKVLGINLGYKNHNAMSANGKVDFLIVGAQKSGTSALDVYLRDHSEIEMAVKKEVHFFDVEANFKGDVDYGIYHRNFAQNSAKLRGECTPIYMYWAPSMKRIFEYNPNMKIIAVLRNPIERAFSHWNMQQHRGVEKKDFSIAIRQESVRCRVSLPLQHRELSYTDRGYYSEQIRRIWRFFPKDQTLFIPPFLRKT